MQTPWIVQLISRAGNVVRDISIERRLIIASATVAPH